MKSVLLIGLGGFGRRIAAKLRELNHQVMAIDEIEERVDSILPNVTSAQIGNTKNSDFLDSLGIPNYDLCIVAIGDDFQSSLETTYLLKEKGAKYVVARAGSDMHARFLLNNGADEVIFPEKQMAEWAAIRYSSDHILDYIQLDEENTIVDVQIPAGWIGKSVGALDVRRKYGINLLATKKNGKFHTAISPDTVLKADETLLVLGTYKNIHRCFRI